MCREGGGLSLTTAPPCPARQSKLKGKKAKPQGYPGRQLSAEHQPQESQVPGTRTRGRGRHSSAAPFCPVKIREQFSKVCSHLPPLVLTVYGGVGEGNGSPRYPERSPRRKIPQWTAGTETPPLSQRRGNLRARCPLPAMAGPENSSTSEITRGETSASISGHPIA